LSSGVTKVKSSLELNALESLFNGFALVQVAKIDNLVAIALLLLILVSWYASLRLKSLIFTINSNVAHYLPHLVLSIFEFF